MYNKKIKKILEGMFVEVGKYTRLGIDDALKQIEAHIKENYTPNSKIKVLGRDEIAKAIFNHNNRNLIRAVEKVDPKLTEEAKRITFDNAPKEIKQSCLDTADALLSAGQIKKEKVLSVEEIREIVNACFMGGCRLHDLTPKQEEDMSSLIIDKLTIAGQIKKVDVEGIEEVIKDWLTIAPQYRTAKRLAQAIKDHIEKGEK
jgi:hypothetical protein